MKTGVEKIIQAKGGDAPAKNQTGVQKIIELLGGDPPAKNQTGVDKIVEILEGGGGGGNPNRVETITGTLADPWGEVDLNELYASLFTLGEGSTHATPSATAYIFIDASALHYGSVYLFLTAQSPGSLTPTFRANGSDIAGAGGIATDVYWYANDGALSDAYLGTIDISDDEGSGSVINLYQYAEYIPTTLTIIWHPLPDQS